MSGVSVNIYLFMANIKIIDFDDGAQEVLVLGLLLLEKDV